MILVIGGSGAGKKTYVREMGYPADRFSTDPADDRPVLYGLQDIVLADPDRSMELLPLLLKKAVVICDEAGCGVIPVQRSQRDGREAVGRLCIALANEAERVIRIVCGIEQVIK